MLDYARVLIALGLCILGGFFWSKELRKRGL